MALSEDDQRKLDEIERALTQADPEFGASVSLDRARRRRLVWAGVGFLIGIVVLIAGLVITAQSVPVGVVVGLAGVLIMTVVAYRLRRRRR